MKISELAGRLSASVGLETLALPRPDAEVTGGYVGDLLSWVMGRAEAGQVWITIMTNINILAVASLAGVSAIVVAEGCDIDGEVIACATEQGINLLRSPRSAFDVAAALARETGL